jgi:hypothetical protein
MSHQYKAGDVVTVFQISPANELVIEGKATIRKRVAEVDEQYRVEFANKPGVTCQRFVALVHKHTGKGLWKDSLWPKCSAGPQSPLPCSSQF